VIKVTIQVSSVNKIRTVSDTKRDFYAHHTRPINSIYRRVVEELMVEMHLLSVNVDFSVEPIYCLGVVTSFERFMQGYRPERDKESIFVALCQSVGGDAQKYRQEAENLMALAKRIPVEEFISWMGSPTPMDGAENLSASLIAIASNPNFKYSRLFAVGIYTLLEEADEELVKDEQRRNLALKQISDALHLPTEKMQKDLELYRSNLEKITQMLNVLEDALQADRKQREKRTQQKSTTE
jgi:photosystem II biogenesis protein Psp29